MKNQINWFEIPVRDMGRAKEFYQSVFDCNLSDIGFPESKMATFHGNAQQYGATGCLVEYEDMQPSQNGTVVYFHCLDMEEQLRKVEQNGGKVIIPKTDIGEHGFFAHFIDCEGNRIALHASE
jgi:hypothetical protein